MPASLFVSYVYEDARYRDAIRGWAMQGLLGRDVVVTGESEDVRPQGQGAIRGHLSPKLQGASAVLVIVGNDTHNHAWVEYEAQHALSSGKRLIVVRVPGTRGAAPPNLRGRAEVAMEPGAIRVALGA